MASVDNEQSMELPENVEQNLAELARRVHELLGSNLIGTYLHGSAVLGGFNPHRSDIDVLVIVRDALHQAIRQALADQVSEQSLPCPAGGLELSVVRLAAAQQPSSSPVYELHVNTHDHKVVSDRGDGDPDLALHFLVCRNRGRLLGSGQPAGSVFAPVPKNIVLSRLRAELEWAGTDPVVPVRYLVLNAARARRYVETGEVVSKVAGGRWALDRTDDGTVIDAALASQAARDGDKLTDADPASARAFAESVIQKIDAALREIRPDGVSS